MEDFGNVYDIGYLNKNLKMRIPGLSKSDDWVVVLL